MRSWTIHQSLCRFALAALALAALASATLAAPAAQAQSHANAPATAPAVKHQRNPWTAEPRDVPWWVKRHADLMQGDRPHDVGLVFLGDSITDGWHGQHALWNEDYVPYHALNLGYSGDRTEHVLWRITHGELDGIQPKVAVLLIGTNNIYMDSVPDIAHGVTAIIDTVHQKLPQTRVLLLAVYPRSEKAADPVRAKIKDLNQKLALLGQRPYVRYLDFGDKFLQPDGTLSRTIMPDFLHPNTAGYRIWAANMNPVLQEMMK